jgi:hypothetical protein
LFCAGEGEGRANYVAETASCGEDNENGACMYWAEYIGEEGESYVCQVKLLVFADYDHPRMSVKELSGERTADLRS